MFANRINKRYKTAFGWISGFISIFFIVMLLFPSDVTAHSNLEQTAPQSNAILSSPPTQVDLWFEDPVVIHTDSIQVTSASGKAVSMGKPFQKEGSYERVTAAFEEELSEDVYRVQYNVIALDGYVVKGEYSFSIRPSNEMAEETSEFRIVKTSPADGEIADATIKQIDLWFSQPAQLSTVGVFGQYNDLLTGESYVDGNDPRHIIIPIDDIPEAGTYQVTWYAKPVDDSNGSDPLDYVGLFYFSVDQVTSLVTDQNRPLVQPFFYGYSAKHIAHALAFLGLLSLAGLAWFQVVIAKAASGIQSRKMNGSLYAASLLGFGGLLFVRRLEMGYLTFQELISIQFIWVPAVQLSLLSLSFWLLKNKLQIAGYSLALFLWPFSTGHSTYPRYGGLLSTLLDLVHLFSISIWMGGLMALITLVPKDNPVLWVRQTGARYSAWAFWSMLLIAMTGVGMTLQYLPAFTLRSLLISDWGKALLLKAVLTLVILILAFFQRRTIQRMGENVAASLVRRGRMEVVYGVLLLFAAAILVESKPSAASQGIFPSAATVDGVSASVSIDPIDVGKNDIYIQFKKAPELIQVKAKLLMPPDWRKENTAFPLGDGTYKLTGNFLHGAGTMMMEVTAYKTDGSALVFPFRIVIPGEMRFNEMGNE